MRFIRTRIILVWGQQRRVLQGLALGPQDDRLPPNELHQQLAGPLR